MVSRGQLPLMHRSWPHLPQHAKQAPQSAPWAVPSGAHNSHVDQSWATPAGSPSCVLQ